MRSTRANVLCQRQISFNLCPPIHRPVSCIFKTFASFTVTRYGFAWRSVPAPSSINIITSHHLSNLVSRNTLAAGHVSPWQRSGCILQSSTRDTLLTLPSPFWPLTCTSRSWSVPPNSFLCATGHRDGTLHRTPDCGPAFCHCLATNMRAIRMHFSDHIRVSWPNLVVYWSPDSIL